MFVIGELHRNLSEVVTIQVPVRERQRESRERARTGQEEVWKTKEK